jgi:uncharacterized protein YjbI with pentapeptide repeats
VDQEQKPHERSFIRELVPNWRSVREQVLWLIRIVIVLIILLGVLTLIGQLYSIRVLQLVQLLVTASIPVVLAVVGNRYTQQRTEDDVLQAYLDHMTELLTNKEQPLNETPREDSLRTVALARTLAALPRLNGVRKVRLLQFLYEANLITKDDPVLPLGRADLSGANFSGARFRQVSLRRVHLREANVIGADLAGADLSEADLSEADLSGANLSEVDLSGAILIRAKLIRANFSGARLNKANLSGARGITNDELDQQAYSLEGATMPNGQKYEEWLKSKGRGEAGENSGP